MSTKANEGPFFYRIVFWTVPRSRRFDARYADAPCDIIVADVKSGESAIREIRSTVERLTRDAATGRLRNTGFGITVDQPATIHVVSLEWASAEAFREYLTGAVKQVGVTMQIASRAARARRLRQERNLRRIK